MAADPATVAWLHKHDPLPVVGIWPRPATVAHGATSGYLEHYWLPLLGPTPVLAYRRLTDYLTAWPTGYRLALGAFAAEMGIGSSKVHAVLARLINYGLATDRVGTTASLAVRLWVPELTPAALERLPAHMRSGHPHLPAGRAAVRFAEPPVVRAAPRESTR